ncbi:Pyrimidine reductase, riboflavin biosynthesis [Tindallia magadiensis]|uniref:Pyrimidine reductase, riboflavin biosynthesis n=1 Tax=Tindallia magadiensis TaxID=69895 RepID=A0A1I3DUG2_9FIRM|nr:dihydrofolate reductase family protein [Tindallia magadiensis]SFH90283.1 Pyrimidine reductase, riboflavin biosynthesis [Tindallia magadiensis]
MLKTCTFEANDIKMNKIYENQACFDNMDKHQRQQDICAKVDQHYGRLFFPDNMRNRGRPYFTGSLIVSMDGRMGFMDDPSSRTLAKANKEDPTGGMADLWMVNVLRTYADAVLLGTNTLHAESEFTGHVYDPELQKYRLERSERFAPVPWNVIISRNPEKLPWNHPVLNTSEIPVLMIIPRNKTKNMAWCTENDFCYELIRIDHNSESLVGDRYDTLQKNGQTHLIAALPEVDFPDWKLVMKLMRLLNIKQVAVESPYWIYELIQEKAMDEVFTTQTGVYAGGSLVPGKTQSFHSTEAPQLELASIHMTGNNVMMIRQLLKYRDRQES